MTLFRSGVKLPYMNKLFQSIKKGIIGTFNFDGNSNQFEYCIYFIFLIIFFLFGAYIITNFLDTPGEADSLLYYFGFRIILFISLLANISRRLKNLKMNKGLLILPFIPIVGLLFAIYLCFASKKK